MWVLGVLAPVVGAAKAGDVNGAVSFGPQNCVSLIRQQSEKAELGMTCWISTNCQSSAPDLYTSDVDFSFICLTRNGEQETQVKHDYGKGGFEPSEDYDTEVACDECLSQPKAVVPQAASLSDAHAQLQQYSTAAAQSSTAQSPPPKAAAFYGPEGCIAAYRSSQGTCIVQTRCTSQASSGLLTDYNYGLTCVDKEGASERHLFGKNSFDAEETFDTLVECELCLGFDGAPASGNGTSDLAADVEQLQDAVTGLQEDVKAIKDKLGIKADAKAEEPKEEPKEEAKAESADAGDSEASDDAPAAAQFLHKFRHHYAEAKPVKKSHRHREDREDREDRDDREDREDDLEDLDEDLDAGDTDSDLDY